MMKTEEKPTKTERACLTETIQHFLGLYHWTIYHSPECTLAFKKTLKKQKQTSLSLWNEVLIQPEGYIPRVESLQLLIDGTYDFYCSVTSNWMGFVFAYNRIGDTCVRQSKVKTIFNMIMAVRTYAGDHNHSPICHTQRDVQNRMVLMSHSLEFTFILKTNTVQVLTNIPWSIIPQYSFCHPLLTAILRQCENKVLQPIYSLRSAEAIKWYDSRKSHFSVILFHNRWIK